MRVDCNILSCLHLDPGYALMSVQNSLTCMEMFNVLDIHGGSKINDVQFMLLLQNITDLSRRDSEDIFTLLDIDHSGEIEFEEFYLLFCILIANKDSYEKEFIYRHSATIFQLIDADSSGEINVSEFSSMGVLFNFGGTAIKRIFNEFDISGDQNLDFVEFRLFTMACIDEARAQETREKVKAFSKFRERLLDGLEPLLRRFIRTDRLPIPKDIDRVVTGVRCPYIPGKIDVKRYFKYNTVRQSFQETMREMKEYFRDITKKIPCIYCCCGYLLCCYCCTDDPLEELFERNRCQLCKCECRCIPCWLHYIRRLWTCCYCLFPCCHCCELVKEKAQHVSRRRKMKWPDPSAVEDEQLNTNEQLDSKKVDEVGQVQLLKKALSKITFSQNAR